MSKQRIADLLLVTVAISWGYSFIAVKALQSFGFDNLTINLLRYCLGSIFIFLYAAKEIIKSNKLEISSGFLIGFCLFCAISLQNMSFEYTSISKSTFLSSLNIILVPFFGFLINKTKVTKHNFIGLIIAIVGTITMFYQKGSFNNFNYGDILALISASGFALQFVLLARFAHQTTKVNLAFWQIFACAVFSLIFSLIFKADFNAIHFDVRIGWELFALGVIATSYGYVVQAKAAEFANEIAMSIILASAAIFASIFDVILFNTPMALNQIIGSALIMSAILYLTFSKGKDENLID